MREVRGTSEHCFHDKALIAAARYLSKAKARSLEWRCLVGRGRDGATKSTSLLLSLLFRIFFLPSVYKTTVVELW